MIVNVSEAKAQLSKLIDLVYHGETVAWGYLKDRLNSRMILMMRIHASTQLCRPSPSDQGYRFRTPNGGQ